MLTYQQYLVKNDSYSGPNQYFAFGRPISSCIALPWLNSVSSPPLATSSRTPLRITKISRACVPAEGSFRRARFRYSVRACTIDFPQGFEFQVDDAGITVKASMDMDWPLVQPGVGLIQQRLVTTGIATWFCLKRYLQFHACVFDIDGFRVMALGNRGAGKSSLLRDALSENGHLVSDDVAVIDNQDNVMPSFPAYRLFKTQALPANATLLGEVPGAPAKIYVSSTSFNPNLYRAPDLIVHLTKNTSDAQTKVSWLSGAERAHTLKTNLYREKMYLENPQYSLIMGDLFNFASRYGILRISRPVVPARDQYQSLLPIIIKNLP